MGFSFLQLYRSQGQASLSRTEVRFWRVISKTYYPLSPSVTLLFYRNACYILLLAEWLDLFLCAHDKKKINLLFLLGLITFLLTSSAWPVTSGIYCSCWVVYLLLFYRQFLLLLAAFKILLILCIFNFIIFESLYLFIYWLMICMFSIMDIYQPLSPPKSSLVFPLLSVLSFLPYLYLHNCFSFISIIQLLPHIFCIIIYCTIA